MKIDDEWFKKNKFLFEELPIGIRYSKEVNGIKPAFSLVFYKYDKRWSDMVNKKTWFCSITIGGLEISADYGETAEEALEKIFDKLQDYFSNMTTMIYKFMEEDEK